MTILSWPQQKGVRTRFTKCAIIVNSGGHTPDTHRCLEKQEESVRKSSEKVQFC